MSNQIDVNAHEFGVHLKQGGWRLGLLVACSVEVGTGSRSAAGPRGAITPRGKVSATAFANKAGTSKDRVLRHLEAWNKAAADGYVITADELEPADAATCELDALDLPEWSEFYDCSTNGRYDMPAKEALRAQAQKDGVGASKVLDIAKNKAALKAAIKGDVEVAKAAYRALAEGQAERREKLRAERLAAGVPQEELDAPIEPAWKDNPIIALLDYGIEESQRYEALQALVATLRQASALTNKIVTQFGHTGVAKDIELVHQASHEISEMQWALAGFIVEGSEAQR